MKAIHCYRLERETNEREESRNANGSWIRKTESLAEVGECPADPRSAPGYLQVVEVSVQGK